MQNQFQMFGADMQMKVKNSCRNAKNRGWRISDKKELSADAKIILVLKNNQPLKAKAIWERAKINSSTFYRLCQVLITKGLIQRIGDEYALWNYVQSPNMWNRLQERLEKAGGHLIELKVNKLRLGDQHPVTGWYEKIYDEVVIIQGFLIPKGVVELEAAANLHVPNELSAGLVTRGNIDDGDTFDCQSRHYEICDCERVSDGFTTYRRAMLATYLCDK